MRIKKVKNILFFKKDFFGRDSALIILPILVDVSKDVKIKVFTIRELRTIRREIGINENAEETIFANPVLNAIIHP